MQIYNLIGKLPVHPTKRFPTRALSAIKSIAIHHSATTSGTPAAFARYHVGQNWPGISYHYVIDKLGRIYKCNPLTAVAYHVGDSNVESIGVCLVGDFNKERPTPAQLQALRFLLREIQAGFGNRLKVKRHQDYPGYSSKFCPGRLFPFEEFSK